MIYRALLWKKCPIFFEIQVFRKQWGLSLTYRTWSSGYRNTCWFAVSITKLWTWKCGGFRICQSLARSVWDYVLRLSILVTWLCSSLFEPCRVNRCCKSSYTNRPVHGTHQPLQRSCRRPILRSSWIRYRQLYCKQWRPRKWCRFHICLSFSAASYGNQWCLHHNDRQLCYCSRTPSKQCRPADSNAWISIPSCGV